MKRVSIVGATGYSGGELTALLSRHPGVDLAGLFGSEGSRAVPFASLHPSLAGRPGPAVQPLSVKAVLGEEPDVALLATPNEISAEVVAPLHAAGVRVIDLSGAFRLKDAVAYPRWYGFTHPSPGLLREAVYGLTEWCNGELRAARLVANPGCYATSVVLALRPLMRLLSPGAPIICDSASGVSGAGKRNELAYSFAELAGNFKAYGVGTHRHEPEIRQALGLAEEVPFTFVAHLLPAVRGILSTIHVTFERPTRGVEVAAALRQAYDATPFVQVYPEGRLPELKDVAGTPRAAIGFVVVSGGRRAVIVSALDNLLKGAASQAVQNLNRLFGFPETEGLA